MVDTYEPYEDWVLYFQDYRCSSSQRFSQKPRVVSIYTSNKLRIINRFKLASMPVGLIQTLRATEPCLCACIPIWTAQRHFVYCLFCLIFNFCLFQFCFLGFISHRNTYLVKNLFKIQLGFLCIINNCSRNFGVLSV